RCILVLALLVRDLAQPADGVRVAWIVLTGSVERGRRFREIVALQEQPAHLHVALRLRVLGCRAGRGTRLIVGIDDRARGRGRRLLGRRRGFAGPHLEGHRLERRQGRALGRRDLGRRSGRFARWPRLFRGRRGLFGGALVRGRQLGPLLGRG